MYFARKIRCLNLLKLAIYGSRLIKSFILSGESCWKFHLILKNAASTHASEMKRAELRVFENRLGLSVAGGNLIKDT